MEDSVTYTINEKRVKKKDILIIKKGKYYFTIKTSEIAFIYTLNDVTYIVDKEGKKFFCNTNLNKLEEELDDTFFRANRQFIINLNYIKCFYTHEKTKLIVEMNVNDPKSAIFISQVTAPKFKEWISKF